ncbi:Hypothetical predicted protein [Prunus dulcis]|uniref:Uncharacterized protein n=1 Tax=Prunus dulcis TaxID=3755 RepID=A0A5E4EYF3_PRUDU|nr:Hypothetical predicted protein [Prunus dulcis]
MSRRWNSVRSSWSKSGAAEEQKMACCAKAIDCFFQAIDRFRTESSVAHRLAIPIPNGFVTPRSMSSWCEDFTSQDKVGYYENFSAQDIDEGGWQGEIAAEGKLFTCLFKERECREYNLSFSPGELGVQGALRASKSWECKVSKRARAKGLRL